MIVPKSHFSRFRRAFLFWQKEFGLVEYRPSFHFVDLSEENRAAQIQVNSVGKVCGVYYSTEIAPEDVVQYKLETPEDRALHEALHLLLWRALGYGWERFGITKEMMREAEEEAVNRLVRIIKSK